jgi:hypothetical protein
MKHSPVLNAKSRAPRSKAKLQASAAALASLAAFGATGAQAAGLSDVVQVTELADGSYQLELSDGRVVAVPAEDLILVDGLLVLSEDLAADLGIASVEKSATAVISPVMTGVAVAGVGALVVFGLSSQSDPASPVFTSDATASVAENQSAAFTAAATDEDSADLTYVISGADAALFNIVEDTGVVTFNAAPDFEDPKDVDGSNDYAIIVTASDGSNTTDQAVTVTVTDVNEAPVFSSGANVDAAENQAVAYNAAATDAESTGLTYVLSGDDTKLFKIDANSGVVTFITAPDFEAPNSSAGTNDYAITVTASDG